MKAGILTLHFANNYGASLQVYSLQKTLELLGIDTTVINYANQYQIDADSLYPTKSGIKRFIKRLLMITDHNARHNRIKKFESFRNQRLSLSAFCDSVDDISKVTRGLEICVVGSDQVWNPKKGREISDVYYLGFLNDKCKRIAYAASIGNADIEDLEPYKALISTFDNISVRETRGKQVIEKLVDRAVFKVLDPTLVVEPQYFRSIEKQYKLPFEKYIFYYSLDGYDKRNRNVELLCKASDYLGIPVVAICPEWKKNSSKIVNVIDAGPEEFLWLIDNATFVFTNSFHGTALSISLEKEFAVLEKYDGKDDRKLSILSELGIGDRISDEWEHIKSIITNKIDYANVNVLLNKNRALALDYLQSSLGETK